MIVFLACDIDLAATSSFFLSSEVYLRWRSSDWYFWLAGDSVIKVTTHCSAEGFTFGRVVLLKGELFRLSSFFFSLGMGSTGATNNACDAWQGCFETTARSFFSCPSPWLLPVVVWLLCFCAWYPLSISPYRLFSDASNPRWSSLHPSRTHLSGPPVNPFPHKTIAMRVSPSIRSTSDEAWLLCEPFLNNAMCYFMLYLDTCYFWIGDSIAWLLKDILVGANSSTLFICLMVDLERIYRIFPFEYVDHFLFFAK